MHLKSATLDDTAPSRMDTGAPLSMGERAAALPVAAVLFGALDVAGVRYGIIQDLASLPAALAGRDDIDLLVDKQDYQLFCSIMAELNGVRGVSLSCYDNVCAGREDWFVPDFSRGAYLHLDLHVGIRVGWEFRKRYLALDYPAIARWERTSSDGVSVPLVSVEDEIRLSLARFAFRLWRLPWQQWVTIGGNWKEQLSRLESASGGNAPHRVEFKLGRDAVSCRVRPSGRGLLVHGGDLAGLRRAIRRRAGFSTVSGMADAAVHLVRKTSYLALRVLGRLMPGAVPPKRRPSSGGLVVALVAPDGLGKSTQVDLLTRRFRWKFGCARAYVGTGEGSGWWFRKGLQQLVFPRRREFKAVIARGGEESTPRGGAKRKVLALGLALWGVLIAVERYVVVKRACRWATRGLIVISDRWPQMVRQGYLDGPMIPSNLPSFPGLATLIRLEQRLYRNMEACRPHLILHLVSDFSVSEKRKPGAIRKEGFEARMALMTELRNRDKDIRAVDASASAEAVNRELFRQIWLSL
ncbi:hypothetical protein ATB98_06325 [Sinorhizobium saheli]|uniref:Thymidylate kinase n=2 Tax=Sinorhizobium saheli TaxID=36856 RepID=A0A178Y415_SINSA|nr:hypothetical protein ATB98_06325 [Sinorhizobium saheli]